MKKQEVNQEEKKDVREKDLADVTGGIPGPLICQTASSVVNMLFSADHAAGTGSAPAGNSAGTGRESSSKK